MPRPRRDVLSCTTSTTTNPQLSFGFTKIVGYVLLRLETVKCVECLCSTLGSASEKVRPNVLSPVCFSQAAGPWTRALATNHRPVRPHERIDLRDSWRGVALSTLSAKHGSPPPWGRPTSSLLHRATSVCLPESPGRCTLESETPREPSVRPEKFVSGQSPRLASSACRPSGPCSAPRRIAYLVACSDKL